MTLDTGAFFEEMGPTPLALLGEVVQTTLYLFDVPSRQLVWSSRPIAGLLGYDDAQSMALGARAFMTLLHPEEHARLEATQARFEQLADREVVRSDYRLRAADGAWHWLHAQEVVAKRDDRGRVIQVLGAIQNVTRARQVAEERSLLHTAVAQADETILVTTPDGLIAYVNPAFERVTGYAREDAIGRHVRLITSGKHDRAFYRRLWAVLLRGETWRGEFVNKRRDGTLYRETATISPVRDHAGTVTHFVAVKRDVTEEERLRDSLAQSQKLEGIGHLAAGVAHDFNNILSAILGYAALVREGLPEQSAMASDVGEIQGAARRAAALTKQLLAFSRKQPPAPRTLELRALVSELERMLRRVVRENVAIQVELGAAPGTVRADPVQLQQLLLNLVVNASDAMPQGGEMRISVNERRLDAPTLEDGGLVPAGAWVVLEVSDTGEGLTEEAKRHLFEPFFTTKANGHGTGLGLATVRSVVDQAAGHVRVRSVLGEGSSFRVYLPLAPAASEATEHPVARALGTEVVWVVEDDAQVRALACRSLERHGFRTVGFGSAEAVLGQRPEPAPPALLITDVVLPGLDGAALAKALRADHPRLPVLFVTGYGDGSLPELPSAPVLAKPFSSGDLASAVRAAIDAHDHAAPASPLARAANG